jgi:glycosyltransferase involved in cell wall biosynthesis
VLFYESRSEFLPVYAVADVFLRPTTTDGDANSIREALHFGIPVVASDVIPRPAGCRLYPFGNHEELVRVVGDVLSNLPRERSLAAAAPRSSAADLLIPIYRELIGAPSAGCAVSAAHAAPARTSAP